MALDIGDRYIGVAISDPMEVMAQPVRVLDRKKGEEAAIEELVRLYNVSRVIAGLPLSLDDKETPQSIKTKTFIQELANKLTVPIELRDEALTTHEARRLMLVTHRRKARQKTHDDAIAASYLLQEYLDRKAANGN